MISITGPRFTNVISIAIQMRWKFRFTLPSILILITTKFCTWHDSCAVVACAKLCCNLMASNEITGEVSIEFEMWAKKSLVKQAPGPLTSKICFGRVGSGDSGLWCSWDGDWASIVSASSSRFAGASCSWPAWTRRLIRSSWRSTNRSVSARKTELQCVSNEVRSFLH